MDARSGKEGEKCHKREQKSQQIIRSLICKHDVRRIWYEFQRKCISASTKPKKVREQEKRTKTRMMLKALLAQTILIVTFSSIRVFLVENIGEWSVKKEIQHTHTSKHQHINEWLSFSRSTSCTLRISHSMFINRSMYADKCEIIGCVDHSTK